MSATASSAEPLRIVVLGDSFVAGYNLKPAQAFPELLENRLKASGRDVVIVNAGVSGDDAAGGLAANVLVDSRRYATRYRRTWRQ